MNDNNAVVTRFIRCNIATKLLMENPASKPLVYCICSIGNSHDMRASSAVVAAGATPWSGLPRLVAQNTATWPNDPPSNVHLQHHQPFVVSGNALRSPSSAAPMTSLSVQQPVATMPAVTSPNGVISNAHPSVGFGSSRHYYSTLHK